MSKLRRIYLDYAASTPLSARVARVLANAGKRFPGNPGSMHAEGVEARRVLETARKGIATILHVLPDEIIFTSGTTEANNLAIRGVVNHLHKLLSNSPELDNSLENRELHIVTSAIEHQAVLSLCKELEREGVLVTYVGVDSKGRVDPREVHDALTDDTVLVSIMYANNEIGTIQSIREIAKVVRQFRNEAIKKRTLASEILFHTDAAQAPGLLPLIVPELGVDLMSFGAHKFYGPKGVGVLWKRRPVVLKPIFFGGGQERHLRSGTENVPSILTMAEALAEAEKIRNREVKRLTTLREYFFNALGGLAAKLGREVIINGSREDRLANNINISILGMDGEVVVLELDARGVAVSTGSACTTDELGPSHVVAALEVELPRGSSTSQFSATRALGAIRITMGRSTTKSDLKYVLKCLREILEKYRSVTSNL